MLRLYGYRKIFWKWIILSRELGNSEKPIYNEMLPLDLMNSDMVSEPGKLLWELGAFSSALLTWWKTQFKY